MRKSIRLLLMSANSHAIHLIVSDNARIIVEEDVNREEALDKEVILDVLHIMGINLTKLVAVVTYYQPASETPFADDSKRTVMNMASQIAVQLHIPYYDIGTYRIQTDTNQIIEDALSIAQLS